MRYLVVIFLFITFLLKGQDDRAYLMNGKVKEGRLVSIGTKHLFFKLNDSLGTAINLRKDDVILVEKYDGKVLVFGKKNLEKDTSRRDRRKYNSSISVEPFNVLLGRISFCYEYMNKEGNIGFAFPQSITFNPVGPIYAPDTNSRNVSAASRKGVNFIGGFDLNFYAVKGDYKDVFIGPRIRYGVDMLMRNIEAYTIQTQIGMKMCDESNKFFHQFSLGFGFVRILASPFGNGINSKDTFGWLSLNYRLGFNL